MDEIILFTKNHWALVLAFLIVGVAVIIEEVRAHLLKSRGISAQELAMLLSRGDVLVVDVRESSNFQRGHILSAINLPIKTTRDDAILERLRQNINKHIVLVNSTSEGLHRISAFLQREGFSKVSLLRGGITAWRSANLPLTLK